jgi:hypothetical protein
LVRLERRDGVKRSICNQSVLISYYCVVNTSGVAAAGTMALTISWHDNYTSRSFTSASLDMTSTTQILNGALPIFVGSSGSTVGYVASWTGVTVGGSGVAAASCNINRN